jgi:hypothetical protein
MSQGLYIITDEGVIVAAAPQFTSGQPPCGIMPAAGQTLHLLTDVDPKILALANPDEFHAALTKHFKSSRKIQTIEDTEAHIFELLQENFKVSSSAKAKWQERK